MRKIYTQAIHFSPIERAELVERIMESYDVAPDAEIQKAWADEAERRLALYIGGDDASLPAGEVFDRIKREQGR